ncbi:UNVERIFIED_CONTAM: hypothetical protein NCL1_35584 [Trichonephila clavipes]
MANQRLLPVYKLNRPRIQSINVKDYRKLVPKDVFILLKDCDASGKLKEDYFSSLSKGYPSNIKMKRVSVLISRCKEAEKLKEEYLSQERKYPLDLGMKKLYIHLIRCDEDKELKEVYFSAAGRYSSNFKMNNV